MDEDDQWLEEEDSEEDYIDKAASQKKRKKSQKQAASQKKRATLAGLSGLDEDERRTLVGEAVRFSIMRQSLQKPLTTGDIKKFVVGDRYSHLKTANLVADMISEADKILRRVFGLTLSKGEQGGKFYFLNYAFEVEDVSLRTWSADASNKALLFTIVSLLHVAPGGSMDEHELFDLLRPLGFSDDEPHSVFGDWKSLIKKKFVGQKYLIRKSHKQAVGAPPVFKYTLGLRSGFETNILLRETFVSKQLFGKEEVDELRMEELMQEKERADDER